MWEEWLAFFFEGIASTADQATSTVRRVLKLFQGNQRKISALGAAAVSTNLVHELLQRQPMLSVKRAAALLDGAATVTTVNSAFARLAELGIVEEKTGGARNRVFAYNEYLRILSEGTEPL